MMMMMIVADVVAMVACDCDMTGTEQCNHRSGVCECWPNVIGLKCDRCAVSYLFLHLSSSRESRVLAQFGLGSFGAFVQQETGFHAARTGSCRDHAHPFIRLSGYLSVSL